MKETYYVTKNRDAQQLLQRINAETHSVKLRVLAWIHAIRSGPRHVVQTITITQGGHSGHILLRQKYYFGRPTCCPCSNFINVFCPCKNCNIINLYHTYVH